DLSVARQVDHELGFCSPRVCVIVRTRHTATRSVAANATSFRSRRAPPAAARNNQKGLINTASGVEKTAIAPPAPSAAARQELAESRINDRKTSHTARNHPMFVGVAKDSTPLGTHTQATQNPRRSPSLRTM